MKDHPGYTGGKFYFEDYIDPSSPASYLHITATDTDVQTLASKKMDQRIIKNVYKTDRLPIFRKAIINFLIAVATRRAQYIRKNNIDPDDALVNLLPRFAFIFHIDTAKIKMAWQAKLINEYLNKLFDLQKNSEQEFKQLFQDNYENDIKQSLHLGANKGWVSSIPGFEEVYCQIQQIFEYEDYNTYQINSDERVINYANENGQLRLETGLNFFVGGQVLDRGITIDNLIGFFYGRSPQKSQMDTVLQHARMYGNRNKEDLCVTRFYTSNIIFQRMREIHQIDEALRQALLKNNDHEIVCIQRANNGNIMPTNPNRLMLSNVITLKTRKTFYPYGFETIGYTNLNRSVEQIEKKYLHKISGFTTEKKKAFKISKSRIFEILQLADKQFLNYEEGVPLNIEQWQTILERLLSDLQSDDLHCYVQTGRRISRYQKNGEPSDSPYTTSTDIVVARNKIAEENLPLIMLLKQEGRVEDGWKGAPFYWPVLVLPELERPLLFEWSV